MGEQVSRGRHGNTSDMYLKLEPRGGLWLATVSGRVSLAEALELGWRVCAAAAGQGFGKVLVDCLAVAGELSVVDRYELGEEVAEYCKYRSIIPTIALLGQVPTVTGFCALVARNRGMLVETFSESQTALGWLNRFQFNATPS